MIKWKDRLYRKICRRLHGVPVVTVVYKPWRTGKNVDIISLVPFDDDPYLHTRFQEIADHIRADWQERIDAKLKESEEKNEQKDTDN